MNSIDALASKEFEIAVKLEMTQVRIFRAMALCRSFFRSLGDLKKWGVKRELLIKKVLGLAITFMLLVGMTIIGTWAYFSDVETSATNQFSAGTLDLKTNDIDGVSQTLFAVNMQPGDTVGSEYITLKNTGSIAGTTLDLTFSYVDSDNSANPVNMSANATAAMIEVTTLNYSGSSLLGSVLDNNTNGYRDIQDLASTDFSGLSGIDALASKEFEIAIKARDSTGSDFQADGINVTITFTLIQ